MIVKVMDEVVLEINISGREKFKEMKVQEVERLIYMGIEITKYYRESNSEPAACSLDSRGISGCHNFMI